MAPTRRNLIGGLGTLAAVGVAGCAEAFRDESGEPAVVPEDVAENQGYALVDHEIIPIEEEVEGEEIETEFAITAYQKEIEDRDTDEITAVYAIISTPSVTTGGKEMNPLVHKPIAEIMEYVDAFDELAIDLREQVDERQLEHEILGQSISVEEHEASVDFGAIVFDGTLITGVIEDEESILLGMGGFSDELDERAAIHTLLANTETTDRLEIGADADRDRTPSSAEDRETTRQFDSDEEFPNHIHIANRDAGDQSVALTLTAEDEIRYDEILDIEDASITTIPNVIEGTGSYRLVVETEIGERDVGFELRDSTADIGVNLVEDEDLIVSPIASRAANRYEDGDQADRDMFGIVVHNRTESDTEVMVTVTPDSDPPIQSDFLVPGKDINALSQNVENSDTVALVVETPSSHLETQYSLDTETEGVHVTILSDGTLEEGSPDDLDNGERSDRESEEDEELNDPVEPENDVIVRSRAQSTVEVKLVVALDGTEIISERMMLETGDQETFEEVLTDSGEYEIKGIIEDATVIETVSIRDGETDVHVLVMSENDLRVDTV